MGNDATISSLDAYPKNTLISIGTNGFTWRKENREIFKNQIDIIVQKLCPSGILVYGPVSEYIFNSALELNIPIYQYDSYTMQQNNKDKLERERKKLII